MLDSIEIGDCPTCYEDPYTREKPEGNFQVCKITKVEIVVFSGKNHTIVWCQVIDRKDSESGKFLRKYLIG